MGGTRRLFGLIGVSLFIAGCTPTMNQSITQRPAPTNWSRDSKSAKPTALSDLSKKSAQLADNHSAKHLPGTNIEADPFRVDPPPMDSPVAKKPVRPNPETPSTETSKPRGTEADPVTPGQGKPVSITGNSISSTVIKTEKGTLVEFEHLSQPNLMENGLKPIVHLEPTPSENSNPKIPARNGFGQPIMPVQNNPAPGVGSEKFPPNAVPGTLGPDGKPLNGGVQGKGGLLPLPTRPTPTVRGGLLNLGPNESAMERAVELAQQLAMLEGENRMLYSRIKQLEADLAVREKQLEVSNTEVDLASQDISKARAEIETVRKELESSREKLRQAAKEELETLQIILQALQKMAPGTMPMKPTVEP